MAHGGDTRLSQQEILNESYDWLLSLLGVSLYGYDDTPGAEGARRIAVSSDGRIEGITIETSPTDTTKLNASLTVSEVVVGTVTTKTITKTIGATSYVKTVAKDSSDNSVIVSTWSTV